MALRDLAFYCGSVSRPSLCWLRFEPPQELAGTPKQHFQPDKQQFAKQLHFTLSKISQNLSVSALARREGSWELCNNAWTRSEATCFDNYYDIVLASQMES